MEDAESDSSMDEQFSVPDKGELDERVGLELKLFLRGI